MQTTTKHNLVLKIVSLAGLFSVLLSGCMPEMPVFAPTEPVTIQFLYDRGSSTTYYNTLIEEFNREYPDITVELVGWRGMSEEAMAEIDVFATSTYMFSFLQEEELIAPLNTFLQQDNDFDLNDFYPSTVNAFSTEGQRWAIPVGADMLVMYYNKHLFDNTNTAYPAPGWTWDDFLNRAVNVGNSAAGIYGYAYHMMGNLAVLEPLTFIYQHGGQLFDDLREPTRMYFNNPATVEAMTWYGNLIHEHHVAPGPGERSMPFPSKDIENGKVAMWMGWYSDEREEHWGVAPLPRDQNGSVMGSVMGLSIAAETTAPDASWLWVRFLSEQVSPNLMPARRSLAESNSYRELAGNDNVEAGLASLEELMQLNLSLEGQLGKTWGSAMGALNTALGMIRGGESAQVALDAAQEQSGF